MLNNRSGSNSALLQLLNAFKLHPAHYNDLRITLRILLLLALLLVAIQWLPQSPAMRGIAGYLPLHSALETLAIVIAMLVFAVGWSGVREGVPFNVMLIACAFFGVGLLDFSHMFSYEGMPDFVTPSSTEKAIDFWLSARWLGSLTLLAVAASSWQRRATPLSRYWLLSGYLAVVAAAHWLILYHDEWLPATFIPGKGLTPFKIYAEYLLVAVNLLAAAILLWRMRKPLNFNAAGLLGVICTVAMSEYLFTLYATVTDLYNLSGHLFKAAAYLFLYWAIFSSYIRKPYVELRESQEQLQATLDTVPDILLEVDDKGHCYSYHLPVEANFSQGDIDLLLGRISHLGETGTKGIMAALCDGNERRTARGELMQELSEGPHWFAYHLSQKRSASPQGEQRFVMLLRDITQRKQVEAQLRKLAKAVEQSPENIVITDLNANIEYVNEAFIRATGYSREEVIGHNPRLLHSGKTPHDVYAAMWRTLSRGETWKGEFINRRKNGEEYVEFAIITPLRNDSGEVSHYVAVKEDVTEKKRTADELMGYRNHLEELVKLRTTELDAALLRAEEASQAKSNFLANMSHEIRTPLNAILGLTHLLRQESVNPQQLTRLAKIDASGRHLLSIISDILDISKIEAGKMVLEQSDFHLSSVLDHVRSLISESAQAKGIRVEVDADGVPLWLRGDQTRLRQALLNLAGNAVKFTKSGTIWLRSTLLGEVPTGLLVRFEVEDTGIGIPPALLKHLFQPFVQSDGSITRNYGGTGLGLSITRNLAELMGGEVGVESRVGEGSTFWFVVQLQRGHGVMPSNMDVRHKANDACEALRDRLPAHILLVEDNQINREVALELLHGAGFDVDTAENGLDAVTSALSNSYDLILMDMQMPQIDGLEATRQIIAQADPPIPPIIALTANVFDEDYRACQAAGMKDFIPKPVEPETLYRVLQKWLPRKSVSTLPEIPLELHELVEQQPLSSAGGLQQFEGLDMERGLMMLRGNLPSYWRLLNSLLIRHGMDVKKVRDCAIKGEREAIQQIAHSLKGASGNLGAVAIASVAAELEMGVKGNIALGELEPVLSRLEGAFTELHAIVASAPAYKIDKVCSTVDISRAREVLLELIPCLAADDIRSGDILAQHQEVLLACYGVDGRQLAAMIESYDYPGALSLAQEMAKRTGL